MICANRKRFNSLADSLRFCQYRSMYDTFFFLCQLDRRILLQLLTYLVNCRIPFKCLSRLYVPSFITL